MGARHSGKMFTAAGPEPEPAGTGLSLLPGPCPNPGPGSIPGKGAGPNLGPSRLPGKGPGPKPGPGPHDEDRLSRRKSMVDTVSIQVDILSGNGSEDKVDNTEEITFEALKKAIDNNGLEEQEKEKRRLVIEKFQKAPFEEIAAQCETKANMLHDRLAQILELTIRPPPSPSGTMTITSGHAHYHSVPVYEMKFPDLCVY